MKPERLVMQAFGPFADVQVLDFAELGGFGFFLIHGPTGSGKTTILDAMVFALYGDTTGGAATEKGARRADDMRSDHASSDLPTEVRFDFSVGTRRYRVVRRPEQRRPRTRGEGSTLDKRTAALWERHGEAGGDPESDGRPLAVKWGEVTREVERILGFRSVQFRQVVMLPQGKFQELLQAKSDEREAILQRLFRSERYLELQQALKAKAQESGKQLQQERDRRSLVLGQSGCASGDELTEMLGCLAADVEEAEEEVRAASAAETAALATLSDGRAAVAKLDELDEAQRENDRLAGGRTAHDERREELRRARAAAQLGGLDAAVHDRRNDLTPKLLALEVTEAALERAEAEREEAGEALVAEQARGGRRVAAAERVRELEGLAGRVDQAAAARVELDEASRDLAAAEAAVAEAQHRALAARTEARQAWDEAAARLVGLEAAWAQGQAATLAATLRPGEACPVCGSTHHPRPALSESALPGEADLVAARTTAAQLRSAYDEARDAADQALSAASTKVATARAARAGAGALLTERERDLPERLREPEALATELEAAQAELAALDEALSTAQHRERDAQAALASAASAHAAARSAHRELAEVVARLEEERLAAISAAGFADEAAYLAARREPAELDALETRVAGYERESAAAAARLRRAAAAADGLARPDIEALTASYDAAREASDSVRRCALSLSGRRDTLAASLDEVHRFDERICAHEDAYAVIGRLSEVAEGDNPMRLSFQRYMLAACLDDVLVVASERLSHMTDGRYTLGRAQGGDRRRALGLDLEVVDAFTGRARHVSTLSGGETFQAALALALGLADVVQAYEGGVTLDTVFVDEGFGSLDPDNLAAALDTLMGLQTGGRLVGIISHVGELRDQIDARLEVMSTRAGSSAAFHVP